MSVAKRRNNCAELIKIWPSYKIYETITFREKDMTFTDIKKVGHWLTDCKYVLIFGNEKTASMVFDTYMLDLIADYGVKKLFTSISPMNSGLDSFWQIASCNYVALADNDTGKIVEITDIFNMMYEFGKWSSLMSECLPMDYKANKLLDKAVRSVAERARKMIRERLT